MPVPISSLNSCKCGGIAVFKKIGLGWFAYCTRCENVTNPYEEKREAQKEWNLEVRYEGQYEEEGMDEIGAGMWHDWYKD